MFMGPLEAVKPWQTAQVSGVVRFRDRVYQACAKAVDVACDEETEVLLHKSMRKVTTDIDSLGFNTAISQLMVLSKHLEGMKEPPREACEKLALMVSPFAPHLGEECWSVLGHADSLAGHDWVEWDEAKCVDATVTMAVQVNGKVRAKISLAPDAAEDDAKELAFAEEGVVKFTEGKDVKKVIYVPGKILNIVAK
jgi:leucyl-tRNA synthetase